MSSKTPLVMSFLFLVLALALNSVIFPDDRMVVKIAMFAVGMAFGSTLALVATQIHAANSA